MERLDREFYAQYTLSFFRELLHVNICFTICVLYHFWVIFTEVLIILVALHIATFHCEGEYLSVVSCCSAISELSMCEAL